MNIIQSNFCKNQCRINHNLNFNIKNNTNSDKSLSSNADFSKANAENYKANYIPNFKGGMNCEKSNSSGIGTLNYQTAFFREPKTDEIVQNYILEKFGNEDEINIVSGACSTGEEAKSYAMMMDSLKGKLKIMGFDISPKCIEKAQNHNCQLIKDDDNSPTNLLSLDSENILLTDNIDDLTEYERKCRDKFRQYYLPKDLPYKVPAYPDAKQKLEDLETLLANKDEFEKQKKQFCEHMQMVKTMSPELAKYDMPFEEIMNASKRALAQQADAFRTVADFETGEHSFDNCTFSVGDVMDLENLYKADSVNVLLYRNALYHTLCTGDNMMRFMKDDAQETIDLIAKKMNKILKKQGLVVFGEEEGFMQGIDRNIIKETMNNNGFKLLENNNKNDNDNIWVKIEDV